MNKRLKTLLEIGYCIEKQLYPEDMRLILMVCGMWSTNGEKAAYFRWIDELYDLSIEFCKKEKLI